MTDQDSKYDNRFQDAAADSSPVQELDAAGRSLSEALRISFIALKVIMIVLVVLFLISGFETVRPDEQALVLRFGKIRGSGEDKILNPRSWPYWVFPYPIEEIVKIPVGKVVDLDIRSFWYYQSKQDLLDESQGKTRPVRSKTLDPLRDGYCLTRSEKQADALPGADGSDYNIVHSKWRLTYHISDPEMFFRNVLVESTRPGELYFDVMTSGVTPLLKNLLEDAVVDAMVQCTIDEAIMSRDTIRRRVEKLVQDKLDAITDGANENICGIKVDKVLLIDATWPRQVNDAFQAALKASQESEKAISQARTYAQNTLNEVAGPAAQQLFNAIQTQITDKQATEALWSQLAGTAQQKIFTALTYKTTVVANAKANADYLRSLLPEYRKRPELVVQNIYRDALEHILVNVDEKFVIQPTEGEELRILINRDPSIKRKKQPKDGTGSTND